MPLPPHCLLAPTALSSVLTDATASTLLALTALPSMLTDAAASALLAFPEMQCAVIGLAQRGGPQDPHRVA